MATAKAALAEAHARERTVRSEIGRLKVEIAALVAEFPIGAIITYGQGRYRHTAKVLGYEYSTDSKCTYVVCWLRKDSSVGAHKVYSWDHPALVSADQSVASK